MEEVRGGPAGPFADLEVIRIQAGMPTTRFCSLIGVPERTWRRHQARARRDRPVKGPGPRPARDRVRDAARRHALAHPAWGHRKVWAMCRNDDLPVLPATVLRLLREEACCCRRITSGNVASSPPRARPDADTPGFEGRREQEPALP